MDIGPHEISIIEKISKRFSKKFRFGYHDTEDIEQQAALYALEGIKAYLPEKGDLENFLCVHVRNRLMNFKRDNYFRLDAPCTGCPFNKNDVCTAFEDKMDCELFAAWLRKREVRKNLMNPAESYYESGSHAPNEIDRRETLSKINSRLDPLLRADFLRILDGVAVPKHRKNKVRQAVQEILDGKA